MADYCFCSSDSESSGTLAAGRFLANVHKDKCYEHEQVNGTSACEPVGKQIPCPGSKFVLTRVSLNTQSNVEIV